MSDALSPKNLFTCQQCGDCCRGYGGTFVSDQEIETISRYLSIDQIGFIAEYCQMSGNKPVLAQKENGYCIFWDRLCSIHPVKPLMCKKWPCIESILVDVNNWHIMASFCPGIDTGVSDRMIREYVTEVLLKVSRPHNLLDI
jgi:Fe-S-cluster containining protein